MINFNEKATIYARNVSKQICITMIKNVKIKKNLALTVANKISDDKKKRDTYEKYIQVIYTRYS